MKSYAMDGCLSFITCIFYAYSDAIAEHKKRMPNMNFTSSCKGIYLMKSNYSAALKSAVRM